jgi:hypothetical protein
MTASVQLEEEITGRLKGLVAKTIQLAINRQSYSSSDSWHWNFADNRSNHRLVPAFMQIRDMFCPYKAIIRYTYYANCYTVQ